MEKRIPFDIKYRPDIESGKYLVETRDEEPARIICWDRASYYPIVALVQQSEQNVYTFSERGKYDESATQTDLDLFLIPNTDYKEPAAKPSANPEKDKVAPAIQWTGSNLKEVIDFTGKSPRFEEWFKSWDEFENYVHTHNDILKLFCEDGSHYEVPVGAWIVRTPDGYNVPSVAKYIQQKQPSEAAVLATMSALKAEFTNYEHFYQCRVKMPSDLGTTTEVWNRGKTPYEAALGVYKRLMKD